MQDQTPKLPDVSPNPFIVPQQPRSRPLKTYTSSKFRTLTNITTSSPNGKNRRTKASLSTHNHLSSGSSHQHVVPARMKDDQQPDEARPVPAPLNANRHRVNRKLPEKLPVIVTLEDLERAKAVTPVTRRHDKRRLQMQKQTKVPSRPSKFARRYTPNQYLQNDEPAAEEQIARDVLQTVVDQNAGSQASVESEESVNLEERIRQAQQKAQHLLNTRSENTVTVEHVTRGVSAVFEEEPENEESDSNNEQ